jgi:hypothetical protein
MTDRLPNEVWLIREWREAAVKTRHSTVMPSPEEAVAATYEGAADALEEAIAWHPVSTKPAPGEYLVLYRSGKMVSASWMLTADAPEGAWVDDWDGESIEDFEGQVVTHWRVLPAGVGGGR